MAFSDPSWEGARLTGSERRRAVSRASRELAASVHEATKHEDDPEVLKPKVTAVIENLQRVTGAMRGEVTRSRGRRSTRTTREQPGTRPEPATVIDVAYTQAQSTVDLSHLLEAAQDLATQLLCRSFSEEVLAEAAEEPSAANSPAASGESISAPPQDADLSGEKTVGMAFEIASYIALRDAGPESWVRKGVTMATSDSGTGVKAAVKTLNYLLGPSALTLIDDLTKLAGDAVKNINAERLRSSVALVDNALQDLSAKAISHGKSLRQPRSSAPASPTATRLAPHPVPKSVSPPSENRLPDPPAAPPSGRRHRPPSSPGTPGIR